MNSLDVKEIRQKLSISQKKLSEMVGVSEKTVQNWEYGKTIPVSKHGILRGIMSDMASKTHTGEAVPKADIPLRFEERLLAIIESQQRTIEELSRKVK